MIIKIEKFKSTNTILLGVYMLKIILNGKKMIIKSKI